MQTPQKEQNAKRFNPLPAPGDFVWCWFPYEEGERGPKARPALVIGVFDHDHKVRVCYGTSQRTNELYQGEFALDPADDGFAVSGLGAATKFNLNKHFDLSFTEFWFKKHLGPSIEVPLPKLGTLAASYYPALVKALGK